MFLVWGYSLIEQKKTTPTIPLSQFADLVIQQQITSITVEGDSLTGEKADKTKVISKKESGSSVLETLKIYGVSSSTLATTTILVSSEKGFAFWGSLIPIIIPILFLGFMIWWLARGIKGANVQALSFGQSRAKVIYPDDTKEKIMFKDVAGAKEAKEELAEIVEFLRAPKKFTDIGAQIPKGVLLMGAPGTGKTMLARAVAGEAGVPFFHLSGSEFEEMFVGVGASRVRDLFDMAKKAAPAIIFIDEIDAVGRTRSPSLGGQGEGREQTLNQILVEMDGFEPTMNLIVMAATNRPDVLDQALLRPGRFDRRVTLDLPDRSDREAILSVHVKLKPLAEDVNLKVIAERTPGFSGADLYSLMNESAILAAREERKSVAQFDLIRSIEKVMLGPERKSHVLTPQEKKITAYHEAGHALVASCLPDADPIHKISIIARGHAGGYTLKLPLDERRLMSRATFLDDIAMSLGGYVTEKEIFGDITTGPSNDLQVATAMARAMVTRYGMSTLGPVTYVPEGEQRSVFYSKEYSEAFGEKIDGEVKRILDEAWQRARSIIIDKRPVLVAIAEELMRVENIEREEFEKLLTLHGIPVKKKVEVV
ncbi:ATP-dependent zinc metalloprotease FtsH [Candidatus Gracilibacteria bacterium]|nr:ATP-dependent zinc metalloprotease FtsH [Candidatus Gracilibacteria bacterium]MCF7898654.1 ATP-dependent zinc metalloprotease FtsH [Candidatus Paceibacterota bacterium]